MTRLNEIVLLTVPYFPSVVSCILAYPFSITSRTKQLIKKSSMFPY